MLKSDGIRKHRNWNHQHSSYLLVHIQLTKSFRLHPCGGAGRGGLLSVNFHPEQRDGAPDPFPIPTDSQSFPTLLSIFPKQTQAAQPRSFPKTLRRKPQRAPSETGKHLVWIRTQWLLLTAQHFANGLFHCYISETITLNEEKMLFDTRLVEQYKGNTLYSESLFSWKYFGLYSVFALFFLGHNFPFISLCKVWLLWASFQLKLAHAKRFWLIWEYLSWQLKVFHMRRRKSK